MRYLTHFLMAFILSLVFTPVVRAIAIRLGFVSYPRAERWHNNPTAVMGGIAIYLAFIIPLFFISHTNRNIIGLGLGMTFLFIIGIIDDRFCILPYAKMFMQIIAGCIAVFFGITIGFSLNNLFAIPLTLLWIVGITNAFNLLDNIDGLAAGIAVISSFMLFLSALFFTNNSQVAALSLMLCGAALGFLFYNFNPAKIFMGDSGSMVLGFSLAIISAMDTKPMLTNILTPLLIPVFVLSVPIFDTLFVMISRKFQGQKIFEGGKDHTSHRLVMLGISQKKAVLLLYAISICFGSITLFFPRFNLLFISILAFLAIVLMIYFGFFLFETTSADNGRKPGYSFQKTKAEKTALNNFLLHKRRIVEVMLDFVFICIAYYAAYFLRFEDTVLFPNMLLINDSLMWIILIKLSVFFGFGLYRGMWRYISISDFFVIFKVVSLGSVFSVLFLTLLFRFRDYSRAVFFIDWLILLFLILGSRFLFRMFGEFLMGMRETGEKVLIFGAGDAGEMVIREIKKNKLLNYNPIGFIDDDSSKVGNKIHGIPVIGSRDRLRDIIENEEVKEVIIAVSHLDNDTLSEIVKICRECGISYRRVRGIFEENEVNDVSG